MITRAALIGATILAADRCRLRGTPMAPAVLKPLAAPAEESRMTWPTSQLGDAERTLLATLSELPRAHPIVSMFAFGLPPAQTTVLLSALLSKRSPAAAH